MSRPRSRSPHYRRFPWEEPGFDPYKVVAELDGEQMDPRQHHRHHHHPREAPEERWKYTREDMHPEDHRRSPSFRDDRQFGHHHHPNQEEFYHRRPSPHHDVSQYENRRLSPSHGGGDVDRRVGGFREAYPNYDNRGRSPHSPLRLKRERLPPTPRSGVDHQEREPGMGWRRGGQGRGRGRFRDLSPSESSDDQRGGAGRERGRRNTQGFNRDKHWEDSHQQRNPQFKRQRREMEDNDQPGYRNEEHFGEQRYPMNSPRNRFQGEPQGSLPHGDKRLSGPVVIEHDHGISDRRQPSHWEHFNTRGDHDSDFDRQRSPRPVSSSQERSRMSERLESRVDTRPHNFQVDWRNSDYNESRRAPEKRPSPMSYGARDSPMKHRGRGGFRPARGRANRGQFGKTGPPRNQFHLHQSSQGYKDYPEKDLRPGYQPVRDDYEDPVEAEPNWVEEDRVQVWKQERPRSLDRNPPVVDLDPKMPRQRLREWKDQKMNNSTAVSEETLTIKVDMSQPVHKNSPLCYSSDRQLSLDLVNVGRQRLDFLPMLEHSGTYRETAVHTGTFAQEIITLVHSVKEQYFRTDGLTLNERFSAPQKGGFPEEETEELTLDERFSSNRGFSLNVNSLLDDDEPLFSRLGSLPPARGPGDLRHDLERRRQERLEGVKVTIIGSNSSQRPQGPVSESGQEYSDQEDSAQMEDEEFCNWNDEPDRRREGNMQRPRRGAPYRQNTGYQRRNNRFGNRLGPIRRQNFRNNPAGPSW
ncbi:LOW QUALITY PROTEIN: BCLAF1 and THRAP3 family member 3-like [Xyrichtys novacula]|uniref:LOW QUALITY PROTEIN: BCLAF1 and THRAP3 family member 3-like n=1 Tax=Xyrichtys novacula TaxID=13765 RepID=A0AAV1H6T2_XYRNO|nr:LOW QUALITY PROTEIN: BCLAF1 and THRAP3 family member 3-like [Xyrichtys novacula]